MSRYNVVKIGTVFLTKDGTVTGKPCKCIVSGIELLKTTKTGQIVNSADGTPYAQLINFSHKGVVVEVKAEWMSKSVFDSIVALHETAKNNSSSIALAFTGDTGSLTGYGIPLIPRDIGFDGFTSGTIKGATFRYSIV
jgi:hypothetical protein